MSRLLVVDDHAIVRSGIRRLLGDREDVEVLEAASGEDALEAVSSQTLDLIVLDLNLPGLGGLELLRRLVRTVPKVPILVFSQHAEAIYATKSLEAGAQGFVSKNALPEEFLEAVDAVLGGGIAVEKSIQREMAMRDLAEDAY